MFKVKNGLVPLTGLLLAGGLMLSGCASDGNLTWGQSASAPTPSSSASSTPTPSASASAKANAQSLKNAKAKVTVTAAGSYSWDYPNRYAALVTSYGYKTVKVSGDEIPKNLTTCSNDVSVKLWIDAICGPLPDQTRDAVVARVLVDADFAYMTCNGLYNTVFSTPLGDISLAENNPWLKEIGCDDASQINDNAAKLVNVTTDAGKLQSAKKLALIAELVERLHVTSSGDGTPAWDYHLAVTGPNNAVMVNQNAPENTIPEFELNPLSYTGKFIYMGIAIKGVTNNCDLVGFNTGWNGVVNAKGQGGDGRFARFVCPPPAPPTTGCTSHCGSTTPSCTVANGCECAYQLNADGQCIPPKDTTIKQPIPTDKPTATPQPVESSPPVVVVVPPVVVVPQKDQGGNNDGHVTG